MFFIQFEQLNLFGENVLNNLREKFYKQSINENISLVTLVIRVAYRSVYNNVRDLLGNNYKHYKIMLIISC
jgi:predicted P-loop ATPase